MKSTNDYLDAELNKVIGEVLKKYREQEGLSLEELSNRLQNKIIRQNLHNYENARTRLRLTRFIMICEALHLDPVEVFDEINMKYLKNAKLGD